MEQYSVFALALNPKTVTCSRQELDVDKLNLVKLCYCGLVLGLRHFLQLPQLPQKMRFAAKVVKSNLKIIIFSLC